MRIDVFVRFSMTLGLNASVSSLRGADCKPYVLSAFLCAEAECF